MPRKPYAKQRTSITTAEMGRTRNGHEMESETYGDGVWEPHETYCQCTCGAPIWEYMQGQGTYIHVEWLVHLRQAPHMKPLLHRGRKP